MQLTTRKINTNNSTLNQLLIELQEECHNVISLVNQLQISDLNDVQKGKILAELLVASVHLHTHCDEDLQELISNNLATLADVYKNFRVGQIDSL